MIVRIWHGWTKPENADTYQRLLLEEIFAEVGERSGEGLLGIELLRRELEIETEFVTILRFDSLVAVKRLAGEDYEKSFVPASARQVLSHFDQEAAHYTVIDQEIDTNPEEGR